jgi:hypothetical protein
MHNELNIKKLIDAERMIERHFEMECENDGWVVSVAITPDYFVSLFMDKFCENPIVATDDKAAVGRLVSFIKNEFGKPLESKELTKSDEKIPNTRAPFHITYIARFDISEYLSRNVS